MNPNVVYPTIQAAKLSKGTTLKLPNVHDASKRSFFKVTVGDRRHARADQHSEVYECVFTLAFLVFSDIFQALSLGSCSKFWRDLPHQCCRAFFQP